MVVALAPAAAGPGAAGEPGHVRKLSAREPGDLAGVCQQQRQTGGRRPKPYGPHARGRGAGQRGSTEEATEQRRQAPAGAPEAEDVEGSALAEENGAQPNAGRTQSRETACSGLSRVRQAALGEKQLRAGLFERLCDAMIRGKSRMSQCSRTDPCGGRAAMLVPTATLNRVLGKCGVPLPVG